MEEGDGARGPEIISSGRIEDWCTWYVPTLDFIGAGGELLGYAQVLSYRSVSVSRGLPIADSRAVVLQIAEQGSRWKRSNLRDIALLAGIERADRCVDQFVYFFRVDDDPGLVFNTSQGSDDHSLVEVEPGYQEPPGLAADQIGYRSGRRVDVAWTFYLHVYVATRRTWVPTPARLRVVRPPPQLGVTGDMVPSVCGQCGDDTWFRPCCGASFCQRCSPAMPHRDGCVRPAHSVPVPPIFRTQTGERVPSIFVNLPHPTWQQYRFITGVRFVLSSYYHTADAYFFDADRGIRFQIHLYRREGPGAWGYRLEFVFRVRPTGSINIRWNLYVARHYVALWPGLG